MRDRQGKRSASRHGENGRCAQRRNPCQCMRAVSRAHRRSRAPIRWVKRRRSDAHRGSSGESRHATKACDGEASPRPLPGERCRPRCEATICLAPACARRGSVYEGKAHHLHAACGGLLLRRDAHPPHDTPPRRRAEMAVPAAPFESCMCCSTRFGARLARWSLTMPQIHVCDASAHDLCMACSQHPSRQLPVLATDDAQHGGGTTTRTNYHAQACLRDHSRGPSELADGNEGEGGARNPFSTRTPPEEERGAPAEAIPSSLRARGAQRSESARPRLVRGQPDWRSRYPGVSPPEWASGAASLVTTAPLDRHPRHIPIARYRPLRTSTTSTHLLNATTSTTRQDLSLSWGVAQADMFRMSVVGISDIL